MKQILTTLLFLFSLTLSAQVREVKGPKKKPQTTAPAKQKPQVTQPKQKPAAVTKPNDNGKHKASKPVAPKPKEQPEEKKPTTYTLPSSISNYSKASDYYQKAMNEDVVAMCELGKLYMDGKDGAKKDGDQAFRWLKKAAEAGNANAMAWLGDCYYGGIGTTMDYERCYYWNKKSADLEDAYGLNNLGACYAKGVHVPVDNPRAFQLYKKASSMGYADATLSVGIAYLYGYGVSKDLKEAERHLNQAITEGSIGAKMWMACSYLRGDFGKSDLTKAYNLLSESSEIRESQFLLAWYSMHGINGVSKDQSQAFTFYKRSAEAGYASAMNQLGVCYAKGLGCKMDKKEAINWYERAAKAGNIMAMYNLGRYYTVMSPYVWNFMTESSPLVQTDDNRAQQLLEAAAKKGNKLAMYWLGCFYDYLAENKLYRNKKLAQEWYSKACGKPNRKEAGKSYGLEFKRYWGESSAGTGLPEFDLPEAL